MNNLITAAPTVQTINLSHAYGSLNVLEDINLTFDAGSFTSVLGVSGSGKSTLLDIIAGVKATQEGTVWIDDYVLNTTSNKRIKDVATLKLKTGFAGYMLQKDCLLPWRTVLENALLGPQIQNQNTKEARAKAQKWLETFGLAEFANAMPAELSGGMRQRVALLRTVMVSQYLLLLDEPLSALDAINRRSLQLWLDEMLAHLGATTIMVTHDIQEALLLSDKIVVLSARPTQVLGCYEVPFAHPRQPDMLHDPKMQELERTLFAQLANFDTSKNEENTQDVAQETTGEID